MTDRPPVSPIAVIGLACRYPDATTPHQLWENILARRRQFRRMPDCRLPLADYHDTNKRAPDKTYGRQAAVIDGFDFDWAGHRIPLSTTRTTDIVHWLALDVSLAAVADAGYTRDTLPGKRTGVIIGNTLTGEQTRASTMRLRWPFVRRALHSAARAQGMDPRQIQLLTGMLKERYKAAFPAVDEDTLAGGLSNTIAGRICNFLNLMGGGFTVDGACASSLLAVAHAASRMAAQELDLAIVGGVDISLDPFELVGFAKTGALTDTDMLVYDRGGKGFIPGEGCGFIVLKPLDAARRDNNPVYAVIHGWGISSDGGGSGITAPNAAGQALALERAYRIAPHDITDLDFIEGHGTGTTVGDRTELEAIARVLGREPVAHGHLRPCGITSLKSIIGHTKAASGIGGLLKAVMAVNRRVIPPTAACREPHQAFDGAARRLYPVRHGRQEAADRSLKAGVSAMGFGGINCHITLASADPPDDRLTPVLEEGALLASAQESELLVLGAATPAAMLEKLSDLRRMANGISIAELTDLAVDLSRQVPADAPVRAAIVVGHPDDLPARLEALAASLHNPDGQNRSAITPGPDCWLATQSADKRIGFLFPGQGAQQLNMAGMLVQRFTWARALLDQADRMTREVNGTAVSQLIFRNPDRAPGPEERDRWLATLSQTENAQPAICLASVLWLTFFSRLGVKPVAVGGHSLGELTACFAAGGLDTATLLGFAAHRGRLMSAQGTAAGAMVSLRCDESQANDLILRVDGYLTVANLNSPRQTVVSGESAAVAALADMALKEGISARILAVSGAFHSRLVADAARQVAGLEMLSEPLAPLSCRLFTSIDGTPLKTGLALNDHFSRQIQSRVDFIRMATNLAACCDLIVELGPGRVLTGLVGDLLGDTHAGCLPVESSAGGTLDMNRTIGALFARGVAIRWERLFENRLTRPFVPAAEKAFIVNPCETLPRADGDDPVDDPSMPTDLSHGVLADAFNGVPEGLVQRYLASRGAFLNQVVQSDLSFWNPDAHTVKPAGTMDRTAPDRAATPDGIQAILFQLVADTTGFATKMLSGASRLLDDLNLDSIKAGDLIGKFAQQCGVSFPDPTLLGNARLGELVDAAHRLQVDSAEPAPPTDALSELRQQAQRITGFAGDTLDMDLPVERGLKIGPDKLKTLVQRTATALKIEAHVDLEPLLTRNLRQIGSILDRMIAQQHAQVANGDTAGPVLPDAGQPTWVRNFAMDLVEDPFPEFPDTWRMRSENDWQRARVLILHSDDAIDVAESLSQNFFQRGALTQVVSFGDETAAAATQDPEFSHLVAILPKNGYPDNDRAALLRRMIRMRASVAAVPPAARTPKRRTAVAWIQFGGGSFGRDPKFARLDRCGATALAASVHLERTDLRVRVVDFYPALPPEVIAWETIAEMSTQEDFAAVGYDLDRTRRTLRPQLVKPAAFARRDIGWSGKDVILVTGGARGITAACALAVARETGARMALVGRTPHPDQAPAAEGSREIRTLLEQYAGAGLMADYVACDIADRDAVAAMIAAVVGRCGPISGLIHGAGLNHPCLTGQVDPKQAFAETAPKVLGLLHILDILAARPPKLIVAIGSIIGISGMPGNGWYGFSNEVMDIALRGFTLDHPETAAVDVAFSIWGEKGMGARMGSVKLLREKGIDAIPTDEGVARFLKLFTHDPARRQVVVTARMAGLDTWRPAVPEAPRGWRFLETRSHITPGVEAVFAAHLALESDPYLKDHHFQGSYLFPTVFGLEAMAQAAQYLLGRTDLSRIQIRDVRLDRPITVDPEIGADIVIRAIVAEPTANGETVVQAGIVKTGGGVEADFFRASLVFAPSNGAPEFSLTLPEDPTPLVPRTDLYRPSLLFQGPRFQGIRTVWAILASDQGSAEAIFTSHPTAADQVSSAAFGKGETRHLSLGDPFFGDTLLQSAALLVPQDTSLPVAIDRMDLFPEFFKATSPATVQVKLVDKTDRDLTFQVVAVGETGAVRAMLSGYRLRILKHHPEYPTVGDLVSPEERDRALIDQMLATACRDLSVTPPIVDLTTLAGIHELPKAARHELEKPLLERALTQAAGRQYAETDAPLRIDWLASGKPGVAGVDRAVMDVALTHEDRTCLCVCAPGPVGCDLAAVTARSRKQWHGLLGDRRSALLEALVEQGDDQDRAGTRIWATAETLTKITGQAGGRLDVVRRSGDAVLFHGDATASVFHILTLPIHLTWGPPQILALSVAPEVVPRVPEHLLTADYPGYEPLYDTRPFEMVEGGPQGQLVFVQRLPVTFQPSANLSRTIYFANFIKWMGNTREASAWPVLAEMSTQFASGRWGGVTNYGHLKILGEGRTSDQIEILMWVSDNSGPHNSTMTLSYDFRQMMPGGGYRRLAYCRLQTTWVEILGPGMARAAPYPAYYGQFIEDMCPRFDAPDTLEPMEATLSHLFDADDDPVVYTAPSGTMLPPIVREQTFATTLAHANLVGNIYYANYYDWQGQIRDRLFYDLIPDYYRGIGEKGELLTLESRVDHLREAMPFDTVVLTLALKELRQSSVTFQVDYFRLEPDGARLKIAHGLHRAVWVMRDPKGRAQAAAFPDNVRRAFDSAFQKAT